MINDATQRVAIIGLGHTGLPLAVAYAKAGLRVSAYDTNKKLVADLRNGVSHVPGVTPADLALGNLQFDYEPGILTHCDIFVVCVPTPILRYRSDLSHVRNAFRTITEMESSPDVIILQSTVPISTTRNIARMVKNPAVAIGYSPERVNPGSEYWNPVDTPRLVSARTPQELDRVMEALEPVCKVLVPVESTEIAEAAKLWENTYRAINIAATYELQKIVGYYDVPVNAVIEAADTKPYGFQAFYPGAGVGGDCIPTDPRFLYDHIIDREGNSIIRKALYSINHRPIDVASAATYILEAADYGTDLSHRKVLVLGASYKPGVADTRNSPGIAIMEALIDNGCQVSYCDPLVETVEIDGSPVHRAHWGLVDGDWYDMIIIANHDPAFYNSNREAFEGTSYILDPADKLVLPRKYVYGIN